MLSKLGRRLSLLVAVGVSVTSCASEDNQELLEEIKSLRQEVEELSTIESTINPTTTTTEFSNTVTETSLPTQQITETSSLESTTTTTVSPSPTHLRDYLVEVIGRRNCNDGYTGGTRRIIGGEADSAYLKITYKDGALNSLGDALGVDMDAKEGDYLACMGSRKFKEAFRGLGLPEDIYDQLLVEQPEGLDQSAESDEFLATWSFTMAEGLLLEISRK